MPSKLAIDEFVLPRDPLGNRPFRGMTFHSGDQSHEALRRFGKELEAYNRGFRLPAEPILFVRQMGEQRPSDFIWTSEVTPVIVSARVVEVLAPFSGWSTYPVDVVNGHGIHEPDYFGLATTGRCGQVFPDLANVDRSGEIPEYIGMVFDPATWDGSDIFYPINCGFRFVSTKLHEALKRANIRNIRFERPSQMRFIKESIDQERRDQLAFWNQVEAIDYESLCRLWGFESDPTSKPTAT